MSRKTRIAFTNAQRAQYAPASHQLGGRGVYICRFGNDHVVIALADWANVDQQGKGESVRSALTTAANADRSSAYRPAIGACLVDWADTRSMLANNRTTRNMIRSPNGLVIEELDWS